MRPIYVRLSFRALLIIGLLVPMISEARPVSYPGGWTVMSMNDGVKNSLHIHFSPTAKTSLGHRLEYYPSKELSLHALQVNKLLKRWNKPNSQGNFYLKTGLGLSFSDLGVRNDENGITAFAGIATDWEDRRRFVSYENRYTKINSIDDFFQQSTRVGWAPYVGDYGDLHTWLMLQVEHMPEANETYIITPLIRFFKDVHLIETGISDRRDFLFNYIFRY